MPTLGFAVINNCLNLIYFDHLSELRCSLLLKSDVNFTQRDVEILRRVFSLHMFLFFYSVPAECDEENSICWEITYLGFYNLFVACLGRCSLLSVFRRLSNTFLCLLWNLCTLLGLFGNLLRPFCHISKQLITNYNFSKPIRPPKIFEKSNQVLKKQLFEGTFFRIKRLPRGRRFIQKKILIRTPPLIYQKVDFCCFSGSIGFDFFQNRSNRS